jgi:hypothetical protein
VAETVKVTFPDELQIEVALGVKAVIDADGFVVSTKAVVAGPLHPAALAVIVDVPLHPAAKVTAPVPAFMLLPVNAKVVPSKLYVIPVEFEAVVIVVIVPAP